MNQPFKVKDIDKEFYKNELDKFLPEKIIDIHTHIWLERFKIKELNPVDIPARTATWPLRVAKENSMEDLLKSYELLFPGKQVKPLLFGYPEIEYDTKLSNDYVNNSATEYGFPSLILSRPEWKGGELEDKIIKGGFLGSKVYLNYAKPYIPQNEIRIFDFLPPHHLERLNKHGWIVMLHIPRNGRLRDTVNLAQLLEIENDYPKIRLIVAHVGRAYCPEDLGEAFFLLGKTKNMVFDISANTNQTVFERLIEAMGPKRILFGSDLPILRMRARRICERGNYINIVQKGMYGDVSDDSHMREITCYEENNLTFLIYEALAAFKSAAHNAGLKMGDIKDIFYNNAKRLLEF